MYAIFKAQGMQFRAEPDLTIRIPSLAAAPGDRVTFEEVLLAVHEQDVRIGTPSLDGAAVAAEVVRHGRGEKIVVYKMKRRKGYRRKQGHRQGFTEIRIVDIAFPTEKTAKKAKAKTAEAASAPVEEPVEVGATAEAEVQAEAEAIAAPEVVAEAPAAEQEPAAADEIDITDVARALAEEHDVDLSTIAGSGKGGRILKGDIDKAIKTKESGA